MKPILIIKNNVHEGPAEIENVLKERALRYQIRDLDLGDTFPDPGSYSAVIVMGGPDSANDQTPKMLEEVSRVQQVIDQRIPYLGVCLGMQVLCKATGGKVLRSPFKELGFRHQGDEPYAITITQQDPIFSGISDQYQVFHLHGETIDPNQWVRVIGKGNFIKPQVIKVGEKAYGTQYHFELNDKNIQEWMEAGVDPDFTETEWQDLQSDWNNVSVQYLANGRKFVENFLTIAGLG